MADTILESLSAGNIFNLRGVVAVVTGGGTGIGMMISSTLVANGATVYIIGPVQADLDNVCATYNAACENASAPGRMHGIQGDIRLKRQRDSQRKSARAKTPLPSSSTTLGSTGGRYARPGPTATATDYVAAFFDAVSDEDFADTLNTNSVGPYWMTFAFLPLLERWKASTKPDASKFVPQIIMTSSMNGWTKDPATSGFSYPYLFSKSALGHATSSLAHELLPLGIRVNGIAPRDSTGVSVFPATYHPAFQVPTVSGVGSARDMGTLALFLVANWFVNGETVLIDGGTLLKHPSSY
ncbi:NAD(P)-binding protein [Mycena sanguinolenta]|uniref:NAD(P)-binding protein n=1 Tax=Mycena sanguinolenta TaxID=230812 RepID=A0A8H7D9X6_9AGAR|nr:NAD(P)-binding protein [Mycena sanguinolenta]